MKNIQDTKQLDKKTKKKTEKRSKTDKCSKDKVIEKKVDGHNSVDTCADDTKIDVHEVSGFEEDCALMFEETWG